MEKKRKWLCMAALLCVLIGSSQIPLAPVLQTLEQGLTGLQASSEPLVMAQDQAASKSPPPPRSWQAELDRAAHR